MHVAIDYDELEERLGRREHHDPRNLEYLVQPRRLVSPAMKSVSHRDARPAKLHLEQQNNGCTGFSMAITLNHKPFHKLHGKTFGDDAGNIFYIWATERDQWEGTYDPTTGANDNGSDGGSAAKGARDHGFIREWRWAPSEELFWAALEMGPVNVGTNWFRGMFKPDDEYVIKPTGSVVGGHEYCVDAYSKKTDMFRIDNSWGREWGRNGFAYIHRADLFDLIFKQQGDVVQLIIGP
jgi:hypothetical protein